MKPEASITEPYTSVPVPVVILDYHGDNALVQRVDGRMITFLYRGIEVSQKAVWMPKSQIMVGR